MESVSDHSLSKPRGGLLERSRGLLGAMLGAFWGPRGRPRVALPISSQRNHTLGHYWQALGGWRGRPGVSMAPYRAVFSDMVVLLRLRKLIGSGNAVKTCFNVSSGLRHSADPQKE